MNIRRTAAVVGGACVVTLIAPCAWADTQVEIIKVMPAQQAPGGAPTGYVWGGMTVKGYTEQTYLTLGAGFTITCTGAPTTIPIENSATFSSNNSNNNWRYVYAPTTPWLGSGSWLVPGFNTWAYNEIHPCWVNYKALAQSSAVSGGVSMGGRGYDISFNLTTPGSVNPKTDFAAFDMVRRPPTTEPGECRPGACCP